MSVRYTGEALAMSSVVDNVALRDVEPWKDRLEVRLDNRQVFFLFFGSAMVACLLFVLGVIVGKKLETRGRAEAPTIEDPLAILDRLGSQGPMPVEQAVTFPKALTAAPAAVPRVHVAAAPSPLPQTHGAAHEAPRGEVRSEVRAESPTPTPHGKPVATVGAASPPRLTASSKSPPAVAPTPPTVPAPLPASAARPVVTAAASTAHASAAGSAAPPVAAAPGAKSRFTLQLSAFQDKSEAEAMVRRLGPAHASVVATEIPGKGTWYRVRAGSFGTFQEASSAKTAFEREHNIIAYVASSASATTSKP